MNVQEKSTNALKVTLPSDLEIVMTRVFNAPRRLVWKAWTDPKHVANWWGPRQLTLTVCESDFRVGGAWRSVLRDPSGAEFGFSGVFREIVEPERIVQTYVFEPMPEHASVVTVVFEEHDGQTTMRETILHKSKESRDGHLHSGMETGAAETLNRLEEYLAQM